MSFKQRLALFFFGIFLGSIFTSWIMFQRKQAAGEEIEIEKPRDYQRQLAQRMDRTWRNRQTPLTPPPQFLVDSYSEAAGDGLLRNVFVLRGEREGQLIRAVELFRLEGSEQRIDSWTVMAADELKVSAARAMPSEEFAASLRGKGVRLLERFPEPDTYRVRLPRDDARAVPESIEELKNMEIVGSAEPIIHVEGALADPLNRAP